jgi:hypothetical protein
MELLAHWALGGDLEARQLWREYENTTFGRRAIQWTPGLRKTLLPEEAEETDVDLASREGEDEVLVTVEIEGQEWDLMCRRGEVGRVLAEIEQMASLFMVLASVFRCSERGNACAN